MTITSTAAEHFFSDVTSRGDRAFQYLEGLVEPSLHTEENEWRDFKVAAQLTGHFSPNAPASLKESNEKKIKEIWSEYLGAFGNSGGGVLLWGIDAPKRIAIATSLAVDANALAVRLEELVAGAVDPPIQGVRVRAITRSLSDSSGFVICLIPNSRFAPHSSKWAEKWEYYIRVQDGNQWCQPALLRRLFYPHSSAALVPHLCIQAERRQDDAVALTGTVVIANQGLASAMEVCVEVTCSLGQLPIIYHDTKLWEEDRRRARTYWCRTTLHPNQSTPFILNLTMAGHFPNWPPENQALEIALNCYARDAEPAKAVFSLTWGDMKRAFELRKPIQRSGE